MELVTPLFKRMLRELIWQPCRRPCYQQRKVKGSMSNFEVVKKDIKHTNRFPGRAGWWQEQVGPHTLLRAPKSEDYREKWSGESRGCYSCKKPTQQAIRDKEGNAPHRFSQREHWNCDEKCCPSSTEEGTNYWAAAKQKNQGTNKN